MEDKEAALILSQDITIGARTIAKMRSLGGLGQIINWSQNKIEKIGIKSDIAKLIVESKYIYKTEKIINDLKKYSVSYLYIEDKEYPINLKETYDPPAILYYKGDIKAFLRPMIAIVGSRKSTKYGIEATEKIVKELAIVPVCIVSGLALGIDSIAHKAALSNKITTIAVLGNGLDTIYPPSHYNLAREIIANNGLIISEFPINTPTYPAHFPMRNRIIAGLSRGVVIIEAISSSGSLITAKAGLAYDREIFALPHSIFSPTGIGPNNLIKNGAIPIWSGYQILDELKIKYNLLDNNQFKLDNVEQKIVNLLYEKALIIDDIVNGLNLDISLVTAKLVMLEMKGIVVNMGGRYSIKSQNANC